MNAKLTTKNTVRIIGFVNGNNPDDKRCSECIDFSTLGPALFTGAEFSCTYCGDDYKDGLTSNERYERKHNVKHCDHCLSYVAPFDGDRCPECVGEEDMITKVAANGVNVDIIEPGKALVSGMGIIRREHGKYVAYADYLPSGVVESSKGLSSYQAAARWMVRTYGGKGKIVVHMHRDGQ